VIPLVRMRRDSVNTASGLKTAVTIVFSDHHLLQGGGKFWWYSQRLRDFWTYFHCAFAETAI